MGAESRIKLGEALDDCLQVNIFFWGGGGRPSGTQPDGRRPIPILGDFYKGNMIWNLEIPELAVFMLATWGLPTPNRLTS